ncbi:MAG TPA: serine/threonine-protein kinase [Bacteroidales bacterium]|nr:serine/threonine-protein kinase [Bacteroidales bacterium]
MKPTILEGSIDKYIIFPNVPETVLSYGKTSIIMLGARLNTKEKVICKQLNAETAKDESQKLRFLLEASISVNHKGIVRNIDILKSRDNLFLIQEYVEGISFKKFISGFSFSEKHNQALAIQIMIKILEALDAYHQTGYIHCNITPENIIICNSENLFEEDPIIKIINLSLSKIIDSNEFDIEFAKNPFNILYSAPELILNKQYLAVSATDIYSAGLIFYEMMCGKHCFIDDHPARIIRHQLSSEILSCSKIPKQIFRILKKATAKESIIENPYKIPNSQLEQLLNKGITKRYTSCKEFIKDLKNI